MFYVKTVDSSRCCLAMRSWPWRGSARGSRCLAASGGSAFFCRWELRSKAAAGWSGGCQSHEPTLARRGGGICSWKLGSFGIHGDHRWSPILCWNMLEWFLYIFIQWNGVAHFQATVLIWQVVAPCCTNDLVEFSGTRLLLCFGKGSSLASSRHDKPSPLLPCFLVFAGGEPTERWESGLPLRVCPDISPSVSDWKTPWQGHLMAGLYARTIIKSVKDVGLSIAIFWSILYYLVYYHPGNHGVLEHPPFSSLIFPWYLQARARWIFRGYNLSSQAHPGKAVKEEVAPSHLSTDLKQALSCATCASHEDLWAEHVGKANQIYQEYEPI